VLRRFLGCGELFEHTLGKLFAQLDSQALPHIAVGTNLKLYDLYSAFLYDDTPAKIGAVAGMAVLASPTS
jgi:hypothetical protein